MNFDELSLPYHILSDARCRIGARLRHVLNPVHYPRRNLDIQSRSDLELLECARDEDFKSLLDKFIMRPNRHRCVRYVAIQNYGIRSRQLQMIYLHLNCQDFRAIQKMFGADLSFVREIDDFLQTTARPLFSNLGTNFDATIASVVQFDRERRLIPNAPQNREVIYIEDSSNMVAPGHKSPQGINLTINFSFLSFIFFVKM